MRRPFTGVSFFRAHTTSSSNRQMPLRNNPQRLLKPSSPRLLKQPLQMKPPINRLRLTVLQPYLPRPESPLHVPHFSRIHAPSKRPLQQKSHRIEHMSKLPHQEQPRNLDTHQAPVQNTLAEKPSPPPHRSPADSQPPPGRAYLSSSETPCLPIHQPNAPPPSNRILSGLNKSL